ncbi:MAG: SprT family zinc-dependent metalloprotease [Alphaproteobacteria bacterium]|nr:SprT family zinc-dependent metalloprotease [Alphaproteobacteria bacterium]
MAENQGQISTITLARADGGADFIVTLRRHAAARRLVLRYYPPTLNVSARRGASGLVLTLPPNVPLSLAHKFLASQQEWMARQIASAKNAAPVAPVATGFSDGAVIPILGVEYRIKANSRPSDANFDASLPRQDSARHLSKIHISQGEIHIAAEAEFVGDLLTVYLKNRARQELQQRSDIMVTRLAEIRPEAAAFRQNLKKIRIGDASTRWGSCSSAKILRYNWRLIFAPPELVDYVVAHEVAHLVEMNHAPRFWDVVHQLVGDHRPHRAWLKQQGKRLFSYGR